MNGLSAPDGTRRADDHLGADKVSGHVRPAAVIEEGHRRIDADADVVGLGAPHRIVRQLDEFVDLVRVELEQLEVMKEERGDKELLLGDVLRILVPVALAQVAGSAEALEEEEGHESAIEKVLSGPHVRQGGELVQGSVVVWRVVLDLGRLRLVLETRQGLA